MMTADEAVARANVQAKVLKLLAKARYEITGDDHGFFLKAWINELYPERDRWICPICLKVGRSGKEKDST